MGLAEILGIAVGLAMDAFAVSLGAGTLPAVRGPRAHFRLAFHFGLFQCLMPVAGWALGMGVAPFIRSSDHWIAFGLLLFVGGRMVLQGWRGPGDDPGGDPSRGWTLVMLSVATSIDALAVGLSLAMLGTRILIPAVVIGLVTGGLSLAGIRMGRYLGRRFGRGMEIAGGVLLIGIGVRILAAHLASS